MKQLEVVINGVRYLPTNPNADSSKPPGEKSVNYRALVNDKLEELGTFYGLEQQMIPKDDFLGLISDSYENDIMFAIAGRVQVVLIGVAKYGGDPKRPLYLHLDSLYTWEKVYHLLLDDEQFIKTGIK